MASSVLTDKILTYYTYFSQNVKLQLLPSRRYEIPQTSGWASSRPTSWSASSRLNSSGKPRVSLLSRPSTPALSKRLPPSNSEVKSCSSPRVSFRPRESSVKSAKGWLSKANDASLRSGSSSSMMLLPLPFWLPELRMYSPVKKESHIRSKCLIET